MEDCKTVICTPSGYNKNSIKRHPYDSKLDPFDTEFKLLPQGLYTLFHNFASG